MAGMARTLAAIATSKTQQQSRPDNPLQTARADFNTRKITMAKNQLMADVSELKQECENVTALVHQLQLPHITERQRARILTELLAASIHLHDRCDREFQARLAQEIESLDLP